MTIATLLLVLGSALVHATWNLWTKQLGPNVRSAPLMWLLTAISAVAYAPFALAMLAAGDWRPTLAALLLIVGSGVIHVVYFLLLLRGYRFGDLSLVYPVARGTGPLLAAAGAIAWFGERATPLAIAGGGLIATGVFVLTLRPVLATARGLAPGLGYGLATGLSIAAYTLWDGWSVKHALIPPLVFYWSGELVRVLLFTPAAIAQRADVVSLWRERRGRIIGIAMLSPLSYILILIAFQHGNLSHIAPAREISILIGAYFGGRLLGEGERPRRLVAAAAFAAGVIALALG